MSKFTTLNHKYAQRTAVLLNIMFPRFLLHCTVQSYFIINKTFVYMFPLVAQTAGLNGLHFFEGTHKCPGENNFFF